MFCAQGFLYFYYFFKKNFFGVSNLATYIYCFLYYYMNQGAGINTGMALTPPPSSIGRGSIPQPSDLEPSTLPLDYSFRFFY